MSALPLKADMLIVGINVCYVPIADIPEVDICKSKTCLYFPKGEAR